MPEIELDQLEVQQNCFEIIDKLLAMERYKEYQDLFKILKYRPSSTSEYNHMIASEAEAYHVSTNKNVYEYIDLIQIHQIKENLQIN